MRFHDEDVKTPIHSGKKKLGFQIQKNVATQANKSWRVKTEKEGAIMGNMQ